MIENLFDKAERIDYNIENNATGMEYCHGIHDAPYAICKGRNYFLYQKGIRKMASEKKNIMTYAGLKKLEDELQDLKVNRRQEVAQKIKEAREQGDLSENAEYDAAKDEQRDIEARIEQLEKILKNAEVIDEDDVATDSISVGCCVTVLDIEFDEEMDFKIVGSTEANSLKGLISNESPLGLALLGKKKGAIVEVEAPVGVVQYKILQIQRSM